MKLTSTRRLKKTTGLYLQHAKDLLCIFIKNGSEVYKSFRSSVSLPNALFKTYQMPSAKPPAIEELLKKQFSKLGVRRFNELYGRDNNVHDGWNVYGNQLSEDSRVLGVHLFTDEIPQKFLAKRSS